MSFNNSERRMCFVASALDRDKRYFVDEKSDKSETDDLSTHVY